MLRTFHLAAFDLEDSWHRELYPVSLDWLVSARQTLIGHRFIRENSDVIIAYHLDFLANLAKLPHSFIRVSSRSLFFSSSHFKADPSLLSLSSISFRTTPTES